MLIDLDHVMQSQKETNIFLMFLKHQNKVKFLYSIILSQIKDIT